MELYQKILNLGPMLPGSLSEQWNVCGQARCRCKSKENPKKHGPYYQLSYSVKGKSSSFFVKKKDLREVKKRMENYKKFKVMSNDLLLLWIKEARENGFKNG